MVWVVYWKIGTFYLFIYFGLFVNDEDFEIWSRKVMIRNDLRDNNFNCGYSLIERNIIFFGETVLRLRVVGFFFLSFFSSTNEVYQG